MVAAPAPVAPAVVRAPEIVGRVLNTKGEVENELFKGALGNRHHRAGQQTAALQ